MAERKRWLEVVLMPLVVAVVGILGTYFLTSAQRDSDEAIAAADREIKLLEILADAMTSSDLNRRIAALDLADLINPELAKKLVKMRKATVDEAPVAASEDPRAAIEGRWVLRRQGDPPEILVTSQEMKLNRTRLTVSGDSWDGEGIFDGKQGHYIWKFKDGRSGRTDISLDETGLLYGVVKGSGIDWTYWASRDDAAGNAR